VACFSPLGRPCAISLRHPLALRAHPLPGAPPPRPRARRPPPPAPPANPQDTCEYTDAVLNYNQDHHRQRTINWVDSTGGMAAAFDFTTKGILQEALGRNELWRLADAQGRPPGMLGMWWVARGAGRAAAGAPRCGRLAAARPRSKALAGPLLSGPRALAGARGLTAAPPRAHAAPPSSPGPPVPSPSSTTTTPAAPSTIGPFPATTSRQVRGGTARADAAAPATAPDPGTRAPLPAASTQPHTPPPTHPPNPLLQEGYAYILLHPGTPCVFIDHITGDSKLRNVRGRRAAGGRGRRAPSCPSHAPRRRSA
jgi:hypothetical protein